MSDYRLSKAAQEDLIAIANFGDERFGKVQSDKYRDQILYRLKTIAEKPYIYPAVDYIHAGYRRSICGAHSIYYRIDKNEIVVVRILYNQDINKVFEE